MDTDKIISFPNELLEKMTIETTIFSPENDRIGVAILSERNNMDHIVRIYQLVLSSNNEEYNFVQEMAAFSYKYRDEVDDFLERLPNMSALEMLMMLHPIPNAQHWWMKCTIAKHANKASIDWWTLALLATLTLH